ncbi:MAG: hypothetical protein GY765_11865 [bacterium]|nr:hypothetical protein [bacterium]
MTTLFAILFFISMCAVPGAGQDVLPSMEAGEKPAPGIRHFTPEDGLYHTCIQSIIQGPNGFLWVGSEGGLTRYDGYKFEPIADDARAGLNLTGTWVCNLTLDEKGLLIGTILNGMRHYDPRSGTLSRVYGGGAGTKGHKPISFSAIVTASGGVIWAGSGYKGLWKFTPKQTGNTAGENKKENTGTDSNELYTVTKYTKKTGLSDNNIHALAMGPNGKLWVGTEKGLDRVDPETGNIDSFFHIPDNPDSILHNHTRALYVDRDHALWVGTLKGLTRVAPGKLPNGEAGTCTHFSSVPGDQQSLSHNAVFSILMDASGDLWVGTYRGLNRLDKKTGKFTRFLTASTDKTLPARNSVRSLYQDGSGVLWVGTYRNGMYKMILKRKKFTPYPPKRKMTVFPICEDRNGVIWLGLDSRGVFRIDRSLPQAEQGRYLRILPGEPPDFPAINISAVCADGNGGLWLGTSRYGLVYTEPGEREKEAFRRFVHVSGNKSSLTSDSVGHLLVDRRSALWCATASGISRLSAANKSSGTFDTFPPLDTHVSTLLEDREGNIWAGTYHGKLLRLDGISGESKPYEADPLGPQGLSNCAIPSLLEDREGNIWIATMGGGLNKLDPLRKHFSLFTIENGLPTNKIWAILEDNDGNLWFSSNKGLTRFSPSDGKCSTYDARDGLQGYDFNMASCYKSKRTGELFFGGMNGLNVFFPGNIKSNRHIPNIHITEFRILSKKMSLEKLLADKNRLDLSYSDAMFSFQFSALDFTNPSRNRYAYKMEGLSDKWIYTGADNRRAVFTKLPPGDYTLKIKGSNNDGLWNEDGVSLSIYIAPPFQRTWWFIGLVGLLVLSAAYQFYRTRINRLSRQLGNEKKLDAFLEKYNISVREKEVIRHLLQGKTRGQIEEALFISSHTVKNHTYNIYKKLGIKNKTELVALFKKSHLILP